jgi:hypothetical protein
MSIMKAKIKKTLEASKRVIRDCAIENGALVAANPTKKYYSSQAKHYFYVCPCDAAFTCRAARCFLPWPITSKNSLKTKTDIWI